MSQTRTLSMVRTVLVITVMWMLLLANSRIGSPVHLEDIDNNSCITRCYFYKNSAIESGGALQIVTSTEVYFTVSDSTFIENHARGNGMEL